MSKPQGKYDRNKTIGKKGYVNHIMGQSEGDTMSDGFVSDVTPMESEIQTPPSHVISSSEDDLMDSEDE